MNTSTRTKVIGGLLVLLLAGTAGGGLVAGIATGLAVEAIQARARGSQAAVLNPALKATAPSAPAAVPVVDTGVTSPATTAATAPVAAPATATVDNLQAAIESVYAQANPSVVYIVVTDGGGYYGSQASGSGFVYDQNGRIVTNAHVVDGAQTIDVVFADGSHQSANLVGEDTANDLAVIQVARLPASAKPLALAADNSVQVGEFVAAIGSPFGEQNSMSFGIVSGLNRSMTSQSSSRRFARATLGSALTGLIQTDVPINPGNSGGPLLDLNGQVVGVNNAIESSSGSNAGVGFAIPVSLVRQVVPGLIANGG